MTTKRINLCLQLTIAWFAIAAVLSLIAGRLLPIDTGPESTSINPPATTATRPNSDVTVDSMSPVFARRFQTADKSTDAIAAGETTATTEPSPPADAAVNLVARLTLVGTIGNSLALLQVPDGTVQMAEIGDNLEGTTVTLVSIRPSQVDFREDGKIVTLRKSPPPSDSALITEHQP